MKKADSTSAIPPPPCPAWTELRLRWPSRPIILQDIPLLYEDEEQGEMGETDLHTRTTATLHYGLKAHLKSWRQYEVFENLNLYYDANDPAAYVSPDVMVVAPSRLPVGNLSSYRIGETGPAPILTVEVLSQRSAQQRDLGDKLRVYALLGIPEYLIVDVMGIELSNPLVLKRLQDDRTWLDERDPDGGATSQLGFRVVVDADHMIRIVDAATGKRYVRPEEIQQRVEELEAELPKLRQRSRRKKP
jgi:Uma2 family endonuclease